MSDEPAVLRLTHRIAQLEKENARLQARLNHWNTQRDTNLVPVLKIKQRPDWKDTP